MPVQFHYSSEIHSRFPQLQSRVLLLDSIDAKADSSPAIAGLMTVAGRRLSAVSEGEFPEIQAWRRAFAAMGLKPTQYRCASEALLRRYRKEGSIPKLHPLIDLCNAVSLAFAIPVAAFDRDKITGTLTVRHASGDELYENFNGGIENPVSGEIIFADDSGRAHARRWTNRQSGWSAIQPTTARALIVAEALHETAHDDVTALMTVLVEAVKSVWPAAVLMSGSTE